MNNKHTYKNDNKQFWYFFYSNLKQIKTIVIIFSIQVIISASLLPIDSYLTKYFIDYISSHPVTNNLCIIYGLLFFLWWDFFNIFYRFYDYMVLKIKPTLRTDVITHAIKYLTGHSHEYFLENYAGSLSAKISDLSKGIGDLFIYLSSIIRIVLQILISTVFLATVHPILGSIVLLYFITFVAINYYFLKPLEFYIRDFAEKRSVSAGKIVDLLANIVSVRFFARKNYEINYLDTYITATKDADVKGQKLQMKINYIKSLLNNIMIGFVIFFTAKLFGKKQLSYGDFYLILTICVTISAEIWQFLFFLTSLTEQVGVCKQAVTTIYQPQNINDNANATILNVSQGEIVFNNVSFKYLQDSYLFNKLSVTIKPKEKVGLVGYSGSGKSSFVNLINRLFDIDSGEILIDGQANNLVTQDSLHENISFIPQEPILFHRTIMENIRYGRLDATDEEVIQAAIAAGAHEFITQSEEQYKTFVGDRGVKLSGGQRQRIAIARAILKNAPILMLDEATSSLDSLTEEYIQKSMDYVMSNRTTLCIAHRLSTLMAMDRILVFDKGAIVEDGTHSELLGRQGIYYSLWHTQINGVIKDS